LFIHYIQSALKSNAPGLKKLVAYIQVLFKAQVEQRKCICQL